MNKKKRFWENAQEILLQMQKNRDLLTCALIEEHEVINVLWDTRSKHLLDPITYLEHVRGLRRLQARIMRLQKKQCAVSQGYLTVLKRIKKRNGTVDRCL